MSATKAQLASGLPLRILLRRRKSSSPGTRCDGYTRLSCRPSERLGVNPPGAPRRAEWCDLDLLNGRWK